MWKNRQTRQLLCYGLSVTLTFYFTAQKAYAGPIQSKTSTGASAAKTARKVNKIRVAVARVKLSEALLAHSKMSQGEVNATMALLSDEDILMLAKCGGVAYRPVGGRWWGKFKETVGGTIIACIIIGGIIALLVAAAASETSSSGA